MTLSDLRDTTRSLSEHTPITAALCLTLCYVCYWIGAETAANRVRTDAIERTQAQLTAVVERIAGLAAGNSLRINQLEQDRARP